MCIRDSRKALDEAKEDAKVDLEREKKAWDETDRASKQEIAELQEQVKNLGGYVSECKEALAQQEMKAEMARLQSAETLREKVDRERDMYLERIKELEEKLASRKDHPTPPTLKSETDKEDVPAKSGGELVHDAKGKKEEPKESTIVPVTEGSHSEKPSVSAPIVGAGGTDVVEGTATVKTTTIESPGTDLTSKGSTTPDKAGEATPSGDKPDKKLAASGEKTDKGEVIDPTKVVDAGTDSALAQSVAKFI